MAVQLSKKAAALRSYAELGIRHFVLSDTPYRRETARVGDAIIGRPARPRARASPSLIRGAN